MQTLEYLSILRRRWFYVALGLVVGVVAGFVTAPGVSRRRLELYQGTHTAAGELEQRVGPGPEPGADGADLENGAVPQRVAALLDEQGQPADDQGDGGGRSRPPLARHHGLLDHPRGRGDRGRPVRAGAQRRADGGRPGRARTRSLAAAQEQVTTIAAAITQIDQQHRACWPPRIPTRAALEAQQRADLGLVAAARRRPRCRSIQAEARLGSAAHPRGRHGASRPWSRVGASPSRSRPGGAPAMLGPSSGSCRDWPGAIASERLDTRVRNKEDAERAFDLPVIAEIPPLPSGTKGRELLVTHLPRGPVRGGLSGAAHGRAYAAGSGEAIAALNPGPAANGNGKGHPNGPRRRRAPGDRGPGAAHHLALRRRGQDHHGRAPGRRAGRVRQAGAGDQRRLPPSRVHELVGGPRASACPTCSSPAPKGPPI